MTSASGAWDADGGADGEGLEGKEKAESGKGESKREEE